MGEHCSPTKYSTCFAKAPSSSGPRRSAWRGIEASFVIPCEANWSDCSTATILDQKSYEKPAPSQSGLQFAPFAQDQRRDWSHADSKKVSAIEYLYGDVSDANSILATIDSGLLSMYQGKDRAAWQQFYRKKRVKLAKELERLPASGLSAGDTKAIAAMRKQMKAFTGGGALFSPAAKCQDSPRKDIAYPDLKSALVACFVEIGNSLSFEGGKINRVSALDLLHEISDPSRRKAVFLLLFHCGRPSTATTSPRARIAA